ncbi:MAG: tetratricopeptide repeat protein [Acidobacteriales bacterium]|nr:tetratricopeptide repeat protein [Terriglobales bacterium]
MEPGQGVIRFGPYEVDRAAGQVRKHGVRIRLSGQPLEVLYLLLERAGETVTREELKQHLWPSDVFVHFESSLNSAVKKLRRTLNDSREHPRYIETQSRKGYRFVAPVERIAKPAPGKATPAAVAPPESSRAPGPRSGPELSPALSAVSPREGISEPLPVPQSPVFAAAHRVEQADRVPAPGHAGPAHPSFLSTGGRWTVVAMVIAGVIVMFGLFWITRHQLTRAVQAAPGKPVARPTIAVLGFKNLSQTKGENWLSVAFSEMISTELQQGGSVRTIPTETIAQVKRDLGLQEKDGYTREVLRRTREVLGCDYIVAGSYVVLSDDNTRNIRLDVRVQESISAETLASFSVTGKHQEIFDLVASAGKEMRNRLAGSIAPEGDVDWRSVIPANTEAAQAYTEGLAHLQVSDGVRASESLQKAVALEPDFALAHASLAEAWAALGYRNRARDEAAVAVSLMGSAPENVRLKIEARQYELQQDWPGAVAAYRHLLKDYPEDLEAGLKLAAAETGARDTQAALATISGLRALHAPAGNDPRIDLTESALYKQQGDYQRQQALAVAGGEKARRTGAQLVLARSKLLEGSALDSQARWDEARLSYETARKIYSDAGNRDGAATALNDIAILMQRKGDLHESRETLEKARREFEAVGDEGSLGAVLANLGENLRSEGQLAEARKVYTEALQIFVNTGRMDYARIVQNNLATVLLRQGAFREARRSFEDLLRDWQTTGDENGIAHAQMNLVDILRVQGASGEAVRLGESAVSSFQKLGDRSNAAQVQGTLGTIYLEMGDTAKARQSVETALKTNEDIGANGDAAVDKLLLAKVCLVEGDSALAITHSQAALEVLKNEKRGPEELQARVVLTSALLAAGRTEEAKRVAVEAASVRDADWLARFELNLVTSRIEAVDGERQKAARRLEVAESEARRAGCKLCETELRSNRLRASL